MNLHATLRWIRVRGRFTIETKSLSNNEILMQKESNVSGITLSPAVFETRWCQCTELDYRTKKQTRKCFRLTFFRKDYRRAENRSIRLIDHYGKYCGINHAS